MASLSPSTMRPAAFAECSTKARPSSRIRLCCYPLSVPYAVVPSKLVIDASAFDAERKGRKQTLISCAVDSTESLQRLVDNVEFVNAARHGAVTIEDDGTRLVYYGLSGRTIVVVR